jgi:hypothetical protein
VKTEAEAQTLFTSAEGDIETEAEGLFGRQEPTTQSHEADVNAQLSLALA